MVSTAFAINSLTKSIIVIQISYFALILPFLDYSSFKVVITLVSTPEGKIMHGNPSFTQYSYYRKGRNFSPFSLSPFAN